MSIAKIIIALLFRYMVKEHQKRNQCRGWDESLLELLSGDPLLKQDVPA